MDRYLSIFVDESGDLGFSKDSSKYYIISLVMHEQKDNLNAYYDSIKGKGTFHAGPLIRKEEKYKDLTISDRKKIFHDFFVFAIKLPLKIKSFVFDKKVYEDIEKLENKISSEVAYYLMKDDYFKGFDIIIYYDNGQNQLSKTLQEAFKISCLKYEFKDGAKQENYRLFQVADLVATIKLIEIKLKNGVMSNSELVFADKKNWKKVYIKGINKKEYK